MKVVMLLSGGVDSATLAYHLYLQRHKVYALTVDYGQRHVKEMAAAESIAKSLPIPQYILDLRVLGPLLKSALTTTVGDIPDGRYNKENQSVTVVPNRNAILLNIAAGYAISVGARCVAYAAHRNDQAVYPDCRPEFVTKLQSALQAGTGTKMKVFAPFIKWTKAEIVRHGLMLGVPYHMTWSCYKGHEKACGKCGTCVERLEAFRANGKEDPIEYEVRR